MVGVNVAPANRGLVQLAQHLGIGDRVHMLGLRSDIQSILGGFDLFVLASAFGESCPTVLIEAMACGVRCVATDVGDSARIIGDTGKIVPVRNAAALAAACVETPGWWKRQLQCGSPAENSGMLLDRDHDPGFRRSVRGSCQSPN